MAAAQVIEHNETEEARAMRLFVEKLEAFRLLCKQMEHGAEKLENILREKLATEVPERPHA